MALTVKEYPYEVLFRWNDKGVLSGYHVKLRTEVSRDGVVTGSTEGMAMNAAQATAAGFPLSAILDAIHVDALTGRDEALTAKAAAEAEAEAQKAEAEKAKAEAEAEAEAAAKLAEERQAAIDAKDAELVASREQNATAAAVFDQELKARDAEIAKQTAKVELLQEAVKAAAEAVPA